jgi:acetoin utilization deacetylase AcuC-like enzyme
VGSGPVTIAAMTRPVLLFEHPDCQLHDPGPGHPEGKGRLPALLEALEADHELRGRVEKRVSTPASEEDLLRVHTPEHVERVRAAARKAANGSGLVWLDDDTVTSALSWNAGIAAAGCAVCAADAVIDGSAGASFALTRPPGHHASADRAMGFCLFNNVAVAVRHVQARGAARRVLVVDWDAHHGNGTQDVFYDDPSVYVLSLHLTPHFPQTGSAAERGVGEGYGTTRNVPLPPGTTAAEHRARFLDALEETLASFAPELVVASVGLDCLEGDPEGGLRLAPEDLHRLTTDLLDCLPASANRRFVGVLEGGYAVDRIGGGLVQVLRALAGLPQEKSVSP